MFGGTPGTASCTVYPCIECTAYRVLIPSHSFAARHSALIVYIVIDINKKVCFRHPPRTYALHSFFLTWLNGDRADPRHARWDWQLTDGWLASRGMQLQF